MGPNIKVSPKVDACLNFSATNYQKRGEYSLLCYIKLKKKKLSRYLTPTERKSCLNL